MNTDTSTFLNLLTVAFVFLLLALPSLIGHAKDLRIDRQLRDAERVPLGDQPTGESVTSQSAYRLEA
ncbi:hypothetical protein [Streptomyces sp. NPDC058657]|uniref:hypothetical protein n=1 Tax=unclassified Streptomyces TaxID=2593676 RepID=UPI00365CD2D7